MSWDAKSVERRKRLAKMSDDELERAMVLAASDQSEEYIRALDAEAAARGWTITVNRGL